MAIGERAEAWRARVADGARQRLLAVSGRQSARGSAPSTDRSRERDGDLVFVLSLARSGTNAFGALLKAGFPSITWEGELYLGQQRSETAAMLAPDFPWVTSRPRRASMPRAQLQARDLEYRRLASAHAPEILAAVLAGRTQPTVIKIFPLHLDRPALEILLTEFRPRVIDLRRRMLFSYVSLMKARASGVWVRGGTPDSASTEIPWSDRAVGGYVRRSDEWTRWYRGLVDALGLETLRVDYEGLYESRADLPRVRAFFDRVTLSDAAIDDDAWVPATAVQDRRSDRSLASILEGFAGLSAANRSALLRYPGE